MKGFVLQEHQASQSITCSLKHGVVLAHQAACEATVFHDQQSETVEARVAMMPQSRAETHFEAQLGLSMCCVHLSGPYCCQQS